MSSEAGRGRGTLIALALAAALARAGVAAQQALPSVVGRCGAGQDGAF